MCSIVKSIVTRVHIQAHCFIILSNVPRFPVESSAVPILKEHDLHTVLYELYISTDTHTQAH